MSEDINYEEVLDGELTKFEQEGMVIEGVLQTYREQNTSKGLGNVYEVKTKNGVAAFFAPSLLHKKLSGIVKGSIVKITYLNKTKTAGGNDLKHFDVKFAPATEENLKRIGIEMYKDAGDGNIVSEKDIKEAIQ